MNPLFLKLPQRNQAHTDSSCTEHVLRCGMQELQIGSSKISVHFKNEKFDEVALKYNFQVAGFCFTWLQNLLLVVLV